MVQDPYSILGIPQGASQDEIKKAYRKKCKEYHPDLHPGDAVAARKMAEVNEAYDMLQNPEKYAKQRQQQSSRSQSGYGQSGYGQNSYGGYRQGNQQSDRGYQGAGGWYSDFGGFDFDDFFGFGGSESSGPSRPQHESGDTMEFRRAIDAINARQYQQAITILNQVVSTYRNARYYYLCALANEGAGNTIAALEQIQKAIQMDSNNQEYRRVYTRLRRSNESYSERSQGFNMDPGNLSKCCTTFCLAQMFCNCCLPRF